MTVIWPSVSAEAAVRLPWWLPGAGGLVVQRHHPHTLAGGAGQGGLDVVGPAELGDAQHQHEQQRHHQGELHRGGPAFRATSHGRFLSCLRPVKRCKAQRLTGAAVRAAGYGAARKRGHDLVEEAVQSCRGGRRRR